ncbi:MAG: DUF1003 domain-containing protein [Gammaproteobacteria bacterium]|nr:DUF1003 domain-containing protein [Gammaproteobacteria bacterium]MBV9619442.1 DUF1003 domain-containing protein [Gammaproteobacteria bacterium]
MTSPDSAPESVPRAETLPEQISQNIADIVELQRREDESVPPAQRRLERIGRQVARPLYLVVLLLGVVGWAAANLILLRSGRAFDPPPFYWLQALVSLTALLTSTIVLIGQRRQIRLSEQRAHLDLQINLLTEQKVTKLIHLLEELRRDLPMVHDRYDPHVSALKEEADAAQVLSALKDTAEATERARRPDRSR